VAASGLPAYKHFVLYGAKEGRDPSAEFNASYYLQLYPDVAASYISPFEHYYTFGKNEGRRPSSQITIPDGSTDTVNGSELADTITGNADANTINGLGGNDIIYGKGGADTIDGGAGNDSITGGTGNDTLKGGTGNDTINGEAGDDSLDGGTGNDTLEGGNGADTIQGKEGADTITGGLGDDTIDGGDDDDVITGGEGKDTLTGGDGFDRFLYTTLNEGSATPGEGDSLSAEDFISSEDTLEFNASVFGDSGLSGTISLARVAFNTDEATTLANLTTAAGTDQEGYAVQFDGSTLDATLYDAVDTALATGAAAIGKGFVVISNGTDTVVLFDNEFGTATNSSLVEMVTLTGMASVSGMVSNQDLVIY